MRVTRVVRRTEPEQALAQGTPLDVCDQFIASVRAKANKNETNARRGALFVTVSTAAIPVLLVASTGEAGQLLLGKVAPASLAAIAATVATWIVERPHERWQLYRGYQRIFEAERLKYNARLAEYGSDDRDSVFVQTLSELQLRLHEDWAVLVPRSAEAAVAARAR
jgi:hypothetical protein